MKLTMYGTRGSTPTPSNPKFSTIEFGGETTCKHIEASDGSDYIVDAGSGIRPLGNELLQKYQGAVEARILISHPHWDHIQGFPFFKPAYSPAGKLAVYSGHHEVKEKLEKQGGSGTTFHHKATNKNDHVNTTKRFFEGQQEGAYFPLGIEQMGGEVFFYESKEKSLESGSMKVTSMWHEGHPGGMCAYKFTDGGKTIVSLGDYEQDGKVTKDGFELGERDKQLVAFAKGADIAIMDCQYTLDEYNGKTGGPSRKFWGHSHPKSVLAMATAAGVGEVIATHHDPEHDDDFLRNVESATQADVIKTFKNNSTKVTFARFGLERMV
ncbi:MAG: phosphoribosyl 1,2-cyclic phosphodiesterase [Candidatus Woesearchaeota archaeon]|jgi:phosphoribosyl 1,2-cyclic phosphodiesterase